MDISLLLPKILPKDQIKTRYIDLVSFASDAGFYKLVPKAVVLVKSEDEVAKLFRFSHDYKIPLVFRTGGTSLAGQSITDGILVDLSQFWKRIEVESNGDLVRVQPGITGAMVNAHLKKYSRKIGPDPSSINSAMMGGILSNNSSGMCCGVKLNSYHTTKYISLVLPSGQRFNTENKQDYIRFENDCSGLFNQLSALRSEILANHALLEKVRSKYKMKTTVGYSLNAFVDYEHPLDILAHLLIGGEGTLAFISEAVLQTVPDYRYKSTALIYFPGIYEACQAIAPLTEGGAEMVELMDRASLRAVENQKGMPEVVKTLPNEATALLVEFQEESEERLNQRVSSFREFSSQLQLLEKPSFTTIAAERAFLWKVRKGLFPAVGAVRASGTTVILEDIAFPVENLGDAILDLQKLFEKFEYENSIIFGHAKDGNIHFVVTQSFNSDKEVQRYDAFITEVVELVVEKYKGTLKAEHGTGRNMAPFVETEWGGAAYEIMKQVKEAVDPDGLLNPGVIINPDKKAHLKNLKALPIVEEEVDKCIECGYCEHVCPSNNLTTSPRRRIVLRRELAFLKVSGDKANYKLLSKQYEYDGLETCAVDGMCALACPVDIDTGALTKRLRREGHSNSASSMALFIAKNFKTVEWWVRAGLKIGNALNAVFGKTTMHKLTTGLKKIVPSAPLWTSQVGNAPDLSVIKKRSKSNNLDIDKAEVLYFPSCVSRILGTYVGKEKNLMETFASICDKTGISFSVLHKMEGSCCSQIFSSKGYKEAYNFMANDIVERLYQESNRGSIPVVIDISSCAFTLHNARPALKNENKAKFDALQILDTVDFIHDMVLPTTGAKQKKKSVVLHPVCSTEKMKAEGKLEKIAQHFANEVFIPQNLGCCGMAGDRGLLFPELTQSATKLEADEVRQKNYDGYYSSTKTCEMAMSEAVQKNYESILYLVDEGM